MKIIAIKNGIFMFLCFAGLFLFMHEIIGTQNYHLRVLNGIFHLGFMYLAIVQYRRRHPESTANHISGVAMGMFTSIIGIIPFVLFIMFYLMSDEAFMQHIQQSVGIGKYFTPFTTSLLILVEGVVISLVGSYVVTRFVDMKRMRKNPDMREQYYE